MEDGCWLRKPNDTSHINVAELGAAIKGINLCIKWGFQEAELKTDSAVVYGWLSSAINDTHRIRTHGMSDMLIGSRLDVICELLKSHTLKLLVKQIPTKENMLMI